VPGIYIRTRDRSAKSEGFLWWCASCLLIVTDILAPFIVSPRLSFSSFSYCIFDDFANNLEARLSMYWVQDLVF
jgi:hypothetical protein